jgi:hypothetical protein
MQLKKHERITFELRLASSSLADIDRALGRCQSSVTIVSKGYGRSERTQKGDCCKAWEISKENLAQAL